MNEENASDVADQDETSIESFETYQAVAETVGMIPSLRVKDNVFQAIVVVVFVFIGGGGGYITSGTGMGALAGVAGGLISGIFLSGLVLMVLGFTRRSKK